MFLVVSVGVHEIVCFAQMDIILVERCCDFNIRNSPRDRDRGGGLEGEKRRKEKKGRKGRTQNSIVFSNMESALLGSLLCSAI